ncbi:MAG TPA: biopolymer transporter ExbD [Phenylobacterium sp.]|jgi:biopolymer transport protein ExbD
MAGRLVQAGSTRFRLNQNSEINVTPFVNVMMVLLIVFMVALPVATTSLKLDLPPAGTSAAAQPTYISLQRDGALYIGESRTSIAALPADLRRIIGGSNPTAERVYVRADRGVRYGAFMEVVSRLHSSGYRAVGLINEQI